MPTAPDEGRRRTFSRRDITIGVLLTPILCSFGKKASATCLWGNLCPVARLKDASAQPRTRQLMPKFSQQILPGLPAMSEQTYAEFPVWSESSVKTVQFTPLPKREALKLWHRARDFDRQTKEKGCHGGAVGHMGLQVLNTLIFDFLNYSSGRLDPSYAAIARKANVCERTVADALKRLGDLRIITWIRRCSEGWVNGRLSLSRLDH